MTTTNETQESRQPEATPTMGHYQEKYKHLLGGLECAEQSAVKMEPNKTFGYGEAGLYTVLQSLVSGGCLNDAQWNPSIADTLGTSSSVLITGGVLISGVRWYTFIIISYAVVAKKIMSLLGGVLISGAPD